MKKTVEEFVPGGMYTIAALVYIPRRYKLSYTMVVFSVPGIVLSWYCCRVVLETKLGRLSSPLFPLVPLGRVSFLSRGKGREGKRKTRAEELLSLSLSPSGTFLCGLLLRHARSHSSVKDWRDGERRKGEARQHQQVAPGISQPVPKVCDVLS